MPFISVSFPIERHIDAAKVAEVSAAVGREPTKQGMLHKSNDAGDLDVFGLLKFEYATKAEARKLQAALKSFGEVRDLA